MVTVSSHPHAGSAVGEERLVLVRRAVRGLSHRASAEDPRRAANAEVLGQRGGERLGDTLKGGHRTESGRLDFVESLRVNQSIGIVKEKGA